MESSSVNKRIPPQNIEAEQSVIGNMLLSQEAVIEAADHLEAGDFYRDAHKVIFNACAVLFNRGENCDMVTVSNYLKDKNQLDQVGGPAYIASLTDTIPAASTVEGHCRIIKDQSVKRQLIVSSSGMADQCFQGHETEYIVDAFGQQFFAITADKKASVKHMTSLAPSVFKDIEKRVDSGGTLGIATEFFNLDRVTSGLVPKDLIILAGRPSMGKTALAMNITTNVAQQGVGVQWFSMEMSAEQLTERAISSLSGISGDALRRGLIQESDWPRLTRAAGIMNDLSISIDDSPALSLTELRARAKRQAIKHSLGLIVVDYLQLMVGRGDNREQEISSISRGLKALAKELDVPVLALSQLNRSLEKRVDKRPILSDLRESGAIEQDADVIIFIYRDEVYNKASDNPRKGIAEILIAKQRRGPTESIDLGFDGAKTMFFNIVEG